MFHNVWLFPRTFPRPQAQSPSSLPPFLNLAKRESNSCRQPLLSLRFSFIIIAMSLKAMCALRLGFLDAFPHYPLQNGTCCRTPRRVATLRAARGKQCWDAGGFSEQRLFRTYFTALIARKSPSCFYLRMRRAFPNCATFSGAAAMTSALQNSFFTSEKIIIIPTLPRSVYGVAAFSIFFFSFSLAVL